MLLFDTMPIIFSFFAPIVSAFEYDWLLGGGGAAQLPPPPCLSYALVQATVGVGTVLIWYLILIRYQI